VCTPAKIEALAEISQALDAKQTHRPCQLFMDSGIRSGLDIFKAIACGADMVFIGRPVLHGLAVGGEEGVQHVIEILRREFVYAMKLSGCPTVAHIRSNPRMVVHESHYVSKF